MSEHKGFYLWLLQVLTLHGFIAFLIWATVRPNTPTFAVIDLDVFALAHEDAIATAHPHGRSTSMNFSLEIYNPNKKMVTFYDYLNVTLYSSSVHIGGSIVSSFHQGFHETTQRNGSMNATNTHLVKSVFGGVLNRTVDLEVSVVTVVQYRILGVMTRHHRIDVHGHVPVGSKGRMDGIRKIMLHTPLR